MGTLYLVRHGQASFGAADYDQLSELGQRQCARLGAWLAGHGIAFDAVFTGTLKRHAQSLAAIESTLGGQARVQRRTALDEYDSHALIRAVRPEALLDSAATPQQAREHFRALREGLLAWMDGSAQPIGMPTHAAFAGGIAQVLAELQAGHAQNRNALVVSSGGPIANAIGQVLGLAAEAVVELNLQLRNSALSELRVTSKRLALVSFNTLPHLAAPEHAGWVTHA